MSEKQNGVQCNLFRFIEEGRFIIKIKNVISLHVVCNGFFLKNEIGLSTNINLRNYVRT